MVLRVMLHEWRGYRTLAFNWLTWHWGWGRWHYHIDKYGGCIMTWCWEKDEQGTQSDAVDVREMHGVLDLGGDE